MTKHTKRMDKLYRTTYPILMRGLARDLIEYFRKREEVNSNLEETAPTITGEKLVTTEEEQQPTLAAVLSTAFPKCSIGPIVDAVQCGEVMINSCVFTDPNRPVEPKEEISITLNCAVQLAREERLSKPLPLHVGPRHFQNLEEAAEHVGDGQDIMVDHDYVDPPKEPT